MLQKITLNAMLNYIDEHIEKHPININILVQHSGYSRRYLQFLFCKELGIPIGKYIQRRRITRAALLLRLTRLPITLISERLCYDSQQTFTREFRKHTGYTPLQYRKSEEWTFKNQTGHRDLKTLFPIPQITTLPQILFSGISINYKGRIPHKYDNAKKKWDMINSILSKKTKIHVTNAISNGKKSSNEFNIKTIINTSEEYACTKKTIYKNIYAYFTYKGKPSDYVCYVNNLYLNVLSFYGLQRRSGYDLEIISTQPNGEYYFEYYLPIYKDSEVAPDIPDG